MSMIRCLYEKEPNFPATDQHPDAVRYKVGSYIVDAIGGAPTQAEVDVVLGHDAAGTKRRLEAAVQAHLDAKAGARGYDGIMSAATYATSTDVTFAAEGAGYRNFRDSAWRYCYTQLAAVQAGTRTAPTEAQLIAEIDANCPLVLP